MRPHPPAPSSRTPPLRAVILSTLATVAALGAVTAPVPARAAGALEDTQRCLADNTTGRDRKDLVRWIFVGIAAHPELHTMASVPTGADVAADRAVADLFTRLIGDVCAAPIRQLMAERGQVGVQVAFQSLGQLAMQELMTDDAVKQRMGAFTQYLDAAALMKGITPPAKP